MADLRKLDFVRQQLEQYSGAKKKINDSTFVVCPFHSENTPSFRIFHSPATKSPGWGRCYGCGKSVSWDESAPLLGLKPFSYAPPSEQFAFRTVRMLEEEDPEILTFSALPDGKVWRDIPTDFLKEVGCRRCTNTWGQPFVFLPVNIFGEERGYIKARLRKTADKPSYINKKGGWSEDYGLFPYDYAVKEKPRVLVLVEGPRDSLRLNFQGIPTMAILGTQSFSPRKARLIAVSGVDSVILAFDGDCAGIAAAKRIQPMLSPMVNVETFKLWGKDSPYHQFRHEDSPSKAAKAAGVSLWDPGNMPLHKVNELKDIFASLTRDHHCVIS